MSINGGMNKVDVVHMYNGILFSHKKEGDSTICSKMDGPRDNHTKWSNPERHKWCHLCVELKKNDTSRFIYKTNRLPDIYTNKKKYSWLSKGKGWGRD